MFRLILTIALVCVFLPSEAEITSGVTSVHLGPDKQQTCILNDGTYIECGLPVGQWIPIAIYIPSSKPFFDLTAQLKVGDQLIDLNGITIGKVTSNRINAMPLHNTVSNTYQLRITGYILISNIQENSIPENILSNLINTNIKELEYTIFESFIQKYGFYEIDCFIETLPQYKVYFYYVGYYWGNNIHLIFENNRLAAVLHTRAMDVIDFESTKTPENNLLWLKKSDIKAKKKFLELYQKKYEMIE